MHHNALSSPIEKLRVLIVDDDPVFCELLVIMLKKGGAIPLTANTVDQARQAIAHHQFQVVLLDNQIHNETGISLVPALCTLEPAPQILMITANDDQQTIAECFALGVNDYMVKPVNTSLLWEKIKHLAHVSSIQHELYARNTLLATLLEENAQESVLAKQTFDRLAKTEATLPRSVSKVAYAASAFSGDFVLCFDTPHGGKQLYLADAMGHGAAAALCGLPVVATTAAMSAKGLPLQAIMHEINAKLYRELPDDRFVALLGIEITPQTHQMRIINAGMPPALVLTGDNTIIQVASHATPLGIMPPDSFSLTPFDFNPTDCQQVALFTDGLVEQCDKDGIAISVKGLVKQAEHLIQQRQSLENLMQYMLEFTGISGDEVDDDTTLCLVNVPALLAELSSNANRRDETADIGVSEFQLTLQGKAIANNDPLNLLSQLLQHSALSTSLRQRTFTVAAELINNAVDHGILSLSSELKEDIEGFEEYLQQRTERMANLSTQDQIKLSLNIGSANQIKLSVSDSGNGFNPKQSQSAVNVGSGRGLALLENLCSSVTRNKTGNKTQVIIERM